MEEEMRIAVMGASGFIGHHLARYLHFQGHAVHAFDKRALYPYGYDTKYVDWAIMRDLTVRGSPDNVAGHERVYALAADMGGIGYITDPAAQLGILRNNVRINLNTLEAAADAGRVLFTSSVCVYPIQELTSLCPRLLSEEDAIPANPQDSYGWEKLFSEKLYELYRHTGLESRIVRLENTYGPECAWQGGKEKAPAALCRKVAMAKLKGEDHISIWGDGEQRRTFMYVDDCVRGLVTVMESDCQEPVNLGPDESVSIDELADLIMESAGVDLEKRYIEGPQGVRGRNFSHERAKTLGWEAKVSLEEGMALTYEWIEKQVELSHQDHSKYHSQEH